MTKRTIPDFDKDAFNYPYYGALVHMEWRSEQRNVYYQAICARYKQYSLQGITRMDSDGSNIAGEGEMSYPDSGSAPPPFEDMPEDAEEDHEEIT